MHRSHPLFRETAPLRGWLTLEHVGGWWQRAVPLAATSPSLGDLLEQQMLRPCP